MAKQESIFSHVTSIKVAMSIIVMEPTIDVMTMMMMMKMMQNDEDDANIFDSQVRQAFDHLTTLDDNPENACDIE